MPTYEDIHGHKIQISDNAMTKEHPRWEEFLERLEGPEGCNFREAAPGKTVWNCAGGDDKSLATAILTDMGASIEESLAYFEAHGGYCDCEILFNVAD
jgi:Protein of unknown function (DUF2695)